MKKLTNEIREKSENKNRKYYAQILFVDQYIKRGDNPKLCRYIRQTSNRIFMLFFTKYSDGYSNSKTFGFCSEILIYFPANIKKMAVKIFLYPCFFGRLYVEIHSVRNQ